jgi:hypothetical protein
MLDDFFANLGKLQLDFRKDVLRKDHGRPNSRAATILPNSGPFPAAISAGTRVLQPSEIWAAQSTSLTSRIGVQVTRKTAMSAIVTTATAIGLLAGVSLVSATFGLLLTGFGP